MFKYSWQGLYDSDHIFVHDVEFQPFLATMEPSAQLGNDGAPTSSLVEPHPDEGMLMPCAEGEEAARRRRIAAMAWFSNDEYEICPNIGQGDCFWHAQEQLTTVPVRAARQCAQEWAHRHYAARSSDAHIIGIDGTCATQQHIDIAVQALADHYPRGLLILHAPENIMVWFQPGARPTIWPNSPGPSRMYNREYQAPVMLYTEPCGPSVDGHFELIVQRPGSARLGSSCPTSCRCHHRMWQCCASHTRPQQPWSHSWDMQVQFKGGMESIVVILDDDDDEVVCGSNNTHGEDSIAATLRSRGFSAPVVEAALMVHPADLQGATEWAHQQVGLLAALNRDRAGHFDAGEGTHSIGRGSVAQGSASTCASLPSSSSATRWPAQAAARPLTDRSRSPRGVIEAPTRCCVHSGRVPKRGHSRSGSHGTGCRQHMGQHITRSRGSLCHCSCMRVGRCRMMLHRRGATMWGRACRGSGRPTLCQSHAHVRLERLRSP